MPTRFGRLRLLDLFLYWQEASIFIVALLLIAYFENANHAFLLSNASLQNLSQYIAPVAIIACGEIMLMIAGDIDLSAGMTFAFAPFILYFAAAAGLPVFVALLAAVACSGLVGLFNGLVTVKLGIPSFITTLGTLFLLNGITLVISHGAPVSPPGSPAFQAVFGNWGFAEIIWALIVVGLMHIMLRHTRWGLHTIAPAPTGSARVRPASTWTGCRSAISSFARHSPASPASSRVSAFRRAIRWRAARRSCSTRWRRA